MLIVATTHLSHLPSLYISHFFIVEGLMWATLFSVVGSKEKRKIGEAALSRGKPIYDDVAPR